MKNTIYLLEGTYRNKTVENQTFNLVKGYQPHPHKEGGFITVKIDDVEKYPGATKNQIRINVENENQLRDSAPEQPKEESDAETVERMRKRFTILDEMTRACKKGDVRAMIVSGPPGVGKSHGVEKQLGKHDLIATLGERQPKYEVVKGAMSAIGLYCKLYKMADKDNVIVFDDCDSIFSDELRLNILKAALDSKKTRRIHWNTDSFKLRNEGVPDSFEFKGSAIFITNIKFDNVKSKKMRDHLEALESRCHYIDLTIDTDREKMLRIQQITKDGMLDEYALGDEVVAEIVDYIDMNKKKLRELSLRTVLKVADLAKAFPTKWEAMAENTVMRRA